MVISMLKIRRPLGRLIFNMGIAIPGKTVFLIDTAPWIREKGEDPGKEHASSCACFCRHQRGSHKVLMAVSMLKKE